MHDKTVLITGASSGIGRACAEIFAHEGARLILAARREDRLADLAAGLAVKTLPLALDVRNRAAVEEVIAGLPAAWADIDILVNNAGLSLGLETLYEGEATDWEDMIDTNIKGLLWLTRAVVPGMVARDRGHVINIGSVSGHDVYPGGAVYCGRDWSIRGTVIRCNLFHDIRGIGKWENAVYLDDQASGITVTDNLFVRCHWGMLVGGGRDNRIENNLFVDCRLALHFDARGLGWAAGTRPVLEERLAAVPFATLPWSERYPRLVDILRDAPMTPKGNVIRNNTLLRSGKIDQDMAKEVKEYGTVEGNVERE